MLIQNFKTLSTLTVWVKSLRGAIDHNVNSPLELKALNSLGIYQLFYAGKIHLIQLSLQEDAKELNSFLESGCAYTGVLEPLDGLQHSYKLTLNLFKQCPLGPLPLKLSFTESALSKIKQEHSYRNATKTDTTATKSNVTSASLESFLTQEFVCVTSDGKDSYTLPSVDLPLSDSLASSNLFTPERNWCDTSTQNGYLEFGKVFNAEDDDEADEKNDAKNDEQTESYFASAASVSAASSTASSATISTLDSNSSASPALALAQETELAAVNGMWILAFNQSTKPISTASNPRVVVDQSFTHPKLLPSFNALHYMGQLTQLEKAQAQLKELENTPEQFGLYKSSPLWASSVDAAFLDSVPLAGFETEQSIKESAGAVEESDSDSDSDIDSKATPKADATAKENLNSQHEQYSAIANSPLAVAFANTNIGGSFMGAGKDKTYEPEQVTSFQRMVITPTTLNFLDTNLTYFKSEAQIGVLSAPALPERCVLLGKSLQLSLVHLSDDPDLTHYYVVDCAVRHPHDLSFLPTVHLCQGSLQFKQAPTLSKAIYSQLQDKNKTQPLQRLNRQHHGYLKLWYDYLCLTWDQLIERAKKIGYMCIKTVQDLHNGSFYILLQEPAPQSLKSQDQIALVHKIPSYILERKITGQDLIEKAYLDAHGHLIFPDDEDLAEFDSLDENNSTHTGEASWDSTAKKTTAATTAPASQSLRRKGRDKVLYGTIESVRKYCLHVRFTDAQPHPEDFAYIVLSIYGQSVQLGRCLNAYWHIINQNSANPQLGAILEGQRSWLASSGYREQIEPLSQSLRVKLSNRLPDPSQQQALKIALNTPDIALIQGPPGTGKSTVICALIERLNELANKRQLGGAVLISGYQHDTVNHLVSKLHVNALPTLKFGNKGGVSTPDLKSEQIDQWIDNFSSQLQNQAQLQDLTVSAQLEQMLDNYLDHPVADMALPLLEELLAKYQQLNDQQWLTLALGEGNDLDDKAQANLRQVYVSLEGLKLLIEKYQRQLNPLPAHLRSTIYSLRTEPLSFADDGFANAQLLLNQAQDYLTQGEIALLSVTDPSTYDGSAYRPQLDAYTLEAFKHELRESLLGKVQDGDVTGKASVDSAHKASPSVELACSPEELNTINYFTHVYDLQCTLLQQMRPKLSYAELDDSVSVICQFLIERLKIANGLTNREEQRKQIVFDFMQEVQGNVDEVKQALADYGFVYAATVQQSEGEDIRRAKFHLYQQRIQRQTGILPDLKFLSVDELSKSNQSYLNLRRAQRASGDSVAVSKIWREAKFTRTQLGKEANQGEQDAAHQANQLYNQLLDQALTYDTVIIDEAARCNPLDLIIPLMRAKKRIILVGDQNQLPHIVDEQIAQALERAQPNLFKPTPESKGHGKGKAKGGNKGGARAGVTGADAPHSAEESYISSQLKQSLFGYLLSTLERQSKIDHFPRVITLNTQYRMHPVLGKFVSDNFYDGKLSSIREAGEFQHALPEFENQFALWCNVATNQGAESKNGTSRERIAEATAIAHYLKKWLAAPQASSLRFGVITFYKSQVDAINKALQQAQVIDARLKLLPAYQGQVDERLSVNTVDAFQGKEFDVVILSAVRAQHQGDMVQAFNKSSAAPPCADPKRDQLAARLYGHLLVKQRLCVALSRQQRCLMVVGAQDMFDHRFGQYYVPSLYNFMQLCKTQGQIINPNKLKSKS